MPFPRASLLVASLLTTASLGALTACSPGSSGSSDALAAGETSEVSAGDPATGEKLSVLVPIGRLDVQVGDPADEVDGVQAPDGGSLLPLDTSFSSGAGRADQFALAGRGADQQEVTLAVEVDGERYDVGPVTQGQDPSTEQAPADLVLALPDSVDDLGDLDDVSLVVGYDGLEQTVAVGSGERDPGPADLLYDQSAERIDVPCTGGRFRPDADVRKFDCRVVGLSAVPYVPALGWVDDGSAWLVVDLTTSVGAVEVDGRRAGVGSAESTTTLAGQEAARVLDESTEGGWSGRLVFEGPPQTTGPLDVSVEYAVEPEDGAGRADTLTYTDRIDLG